MLHAGWCCLCGCCSVFITTVLYFLHFCAFFCLWHATCCWLWSSSATDASALFEATPNKFEFATLQGAFAPIPKRMTVCICVCVCVVFVGRGLCVRAICIYAKHLATPQSSQKSETATGQTHMLHVAFNLCRLFPISLWLPTTGLCHPSVYICLSLCRSSSTCSVYS